MGKHLQASTSPTPRPDDRPQLSVGSFKDCKTLLPTTLGASPDLLIAVEEGCSRTAFERYAARAGFWVAVKEPSLSYHNMDIYIYDYSKQYGIEIMVT